MPIVFVGDDHHRYFQEKQAETLAKRCEDLEVLYWSTVGLQIFSRLDELAASEKLFLIASRHGAIPAVHWTARNPSKTRKLVLLHPSLHLNIPGLESPVPHFVTTTLICHSRVSNPDGEELCSMAGKFFHDYSVHLTSEPAELVSSLSLLSLR